jgi:hypothetical protein
MLQALQDVVNNPDLAEPFTILRITGQQGTGGWLAGTPQSISVYGTVSIASARELEMIPEADRVHEVRVFHSSTQMYGTSENRSGTSDILVWRGIQYRVLKNPNYSQRGFWEAFATRMQGS